MIKNIVILGSGAGGTIVANKLRKNLPQSEWQITIIDHDEMHHYQPGWLFIPFGIYTPADCVKPKRDFIPPGVDFQIDEIVRIDPEQRRIVTRLGHYDYDWLLIATGCRTAPEEVDGMLDDWRGDIHDFYSLDGAIALRNRLKHFESGRLVLNVCELPYKCPVAPIEFCFLADAFFTLNGVRDKVEIEIVTPLPGIFTKPVASRMLTALSARKNIQVTPNYDIARVNAKQKTIESHRGQKIPYDLLVTIPPNLGAKYIEDSGMGDPMCYVDTAPNTLKAKEYERIYAIGDATNVPTSKAGAVAHYQSDTVVGNILREIDCRKPKSSYDGHATCFIASGYDKAVLIDFNYKVEPLPGKFPFPGFGPCTLLGESNFNYWGKMMFKWAYWNLMMKGHELPLESQMTLAGKMRPALA